MPEPTLVVLGAAVWPGGVASPTLRRRTEWACRRFLADGGSELVLSGGIGTNPPAEADVMAAIARDAGVPATALVLDRQARTTLDTAAFAAALSNAASRRFVVVTDAYHGPRTWLAFRAYGLAVCVSSPPVGRATRRSRLALSFLREIPAMLLYLGHFVLLRLSARAGS